MTRVHDLGHGSSFDWCLKNGKIPKDEDILDSAYLQREDG